MNWSRVKTVLIAALLITNLVLLGFIVFDDDAANLNGLDDQTNLVDKLLAEKQIVNQIADSAPQFDVVPQLTMSYQVYDMTDLARRLIGDYVRKNGIYFGADYQMLLQDNTLYIASLSTDRPVESDNGDIAVAKQTAAAFIQRFFAEDYQLVTTLPTEDGIQLVYTQKYRDYTIYDTAMQLLVSGDRVVSFKRKWMTVQRVAKEQQSIRAYQRALFSEIEQFSELAPTTILSVELGYRLEKTVLGEDIQSGDALPYYKFNLSNDQQVFVPALAQSFSR